MELLADENVETEWIQALRDDGPDLVRVVDIEDLGVSATDTDVLAVATREGVCSSRPTNPTSAIRRPTSIRASVSSLT